jgi:hypothetical protein
MDETDPISKGNSKRKLESSDDESLTPAKKNKSGPMSLLLDILDSESHNLEEEEEEEDARN